MKHSSIFTTATFGILLFTIVAGTITWYVAIVPQLTHLQTVVKKRDANAAALSAAQRKQALLPQARAQYKSIQQDLERTATAIPQSSNTGEFVAALEQVANDTGISIDTLSSSVHVKTTSSSKSGDTSSSKSKSKTLEEELLKKYNATTFDLRLTGSYEAIRSFIDRLRTLDRFNVLTTLSMAIAQDTGQITANLSVSIYHKEAAKAS